MSDDDGQEDGRLWWIRTRVDREDELLAHRTSWIVASQAFLLTAYSMCVVGAGAEGSNPHKKALESLLQILPWTAVTALILLYATVTASVLCVARLRREATSPDPLKRLIVRGQSAAWVAGFVAPLLMPGVFLLTWMAILLRT